MYSSFLKKQSQNHLPWFQLTIDFQLVKVMHWHRWLHTPTSTTLRTFSHFNRSLHEKTEQHFILRYSIKEIFYFFKSNIMKLMVKLLLLPADREHSLSGVLFLRKKCFPQKTHHGKCFGLFLLTALNWTTLQQHRVTAASLLGWISARQSWDRTNSQGYFYSTRSNLIVPT